MAPSNLRANDMALPPALKLHGIANLKDWMLLIESTSRQNSLSDWIDHVKTEVIYIPEKEAGYKDWTTSNELVKMTLAINVDPEFIQIVMAENFACDSYKKLCRFLQDNSIAAVETSITDFLELTENFEKYSSCQAYILAHKSMVSSLLSLGSPLPSLVYCLVLIRAVSQKYPQWTSTQRYHFSAVTSVTPAPTLETLYTTLQDHIRLAESMAPIQVPVSQAHVTGSKLKRNKKWDGPNCQWYTGPHDDTKCFFKYPEQHAEYMKKFPRANYTENKKWRAEFQKRQSPSKISTHYSGFDARFENYNPFEKDTNERVQSTLYSPPSSSSNFTAASSPYFMDFNPNPLQ